MTDRSKTTKKVILVLVAIGLIVGLMLPALVSGQSSRVACDRISQFNSRSSDQLSKRRDKLTQNREERLDKLEELQLKRADRIREHREKFDQSLAEHLERLSRRATNANQSAAVAEFEKTVKEAIATRRAAVDSAREKFIAGVKAAISARRTALSNASDAYRTTVNAAITKAIADCAAGVDASTVRSELQSAVRDAKEDFRQARSAAEKVGPSVSKLTSERREAVAQAKDEFRKTVEAARDKLRDVLGVRAE